MRIVLILAAFALAGCAGDCPPEWCDRSDINASDVGVAAASPSAPSEPTDDTDDDGGHVSTDGNHGDRHDHGKGDHSAGQGRGHDRGDHGGHGGGSTGGK